MAPTEQIKKKRKHPTRRRRKEKKKKTYVSFDPHTSSSCRNLYPKKNV